MLTQCAFDYSTALSHQVLSVGEDKETSYKVNDEDKMHVT